MSGSLIDDVASLLGITPSELLRAMELLALERIRRQRAKKRNGLPRMPKRPWLPADDERLREMVFKRYPDAEIAKTLARSERAVSSRKHNLNLTIGRGFLRGRQ